jgi:hypothetical protein
MRQFNADCSGDDCRYDGASVDCGDVAASDGAWVDGQGSPIGPADSRCNVPMHKACTCDSGEQAAHDDQAADSAGIPFVVQHERNLFFVSWESNRWTLAELEFDAQTCTFVEQRRSHYQWPREAFGVLLSRFALVERVETDVLKRTADDFARWLGAQFRVYSSR